MTNYRPNITLNEGKIAAVENIGKEKLVKNKTRLAVVILALVLIFNRSYSKGQTAQITLRVTTPKADCTYPVHATIELPGQFAEVPVEEISVVLRDQGKTGADVQGQIAINKAKAQLWWILPCEKTGSPSTWTATLSRREKTDRKSFSWKDTPADHLDLLFDGRKVMRYVYLRDTSTLQRSFETNKVFHHVFDAQGKKLLTNSDPKALYPHHRGLFIGWQKVTCRDEGYDFWGMSRNNTAQVHQKFLEQTTGPILARSKALIHWNDKDGNPIIAEERQTTAFRQKEPSILLLEFKTTLKAAKDTVLLHSNNPAKAVEHGGIQYRPHNDVAKGSKRSKTHTESIAEEDKVKYLFHVDSVNPKKVFDLPWVAMSHGLNGKHYTIQHINHPANPKPTFYSAYRAYGRFGAYFEKQIKVGKPLTLCYYIWVIESKMPERWELARRYSTLVNTPTVEVLSYE